MVEAPDGVGPGDELDLDRYQLVEVRDEVLDIIDLRSAIVGLAARAAVGPIAIGVVTLIVALGAMSAWVAAAVALLAALLAIVPSMAIGGWLVARQRLDAVVEASARVVDTVSLMHDDVNRIRAGAADVSVHDIATELLEQAVVPLVFGTVTRTAGGLLGPFRFVADRVAAVPMRWVQDAVVHAVGLLPDATLGGLVDDAIEAAPDVDPLRRHYDDIVGRLGDIVTQASRGSTIVGLGLAAMTSLPLLFWWILVWVIS